MKYQRSHVKSIHCFPEQNSTWTQLGLSEAMSRSDFLTYSTYAALDVATDINNRDCGIGDPECFMPEMEYREVWPRDWDLKRT